MAIPIIGDALNTMRGVVDQGLFTILIFIMAFSIVALLILLLIKEGVFKNIGFSLRSNPSGAGKSKKTKKSSKGGDEGIENDLENEFEASDSMPAGGEEDEFAIDDDFEEEGDDFEDEDFEDEEFGDEGFSGGGAQNRRIDELESRLNTVENQVEDVSNKIQNVREENESAMEQLDDMQADIRKLLEIYEVVSQGINPFVGEGEETEGFDLFEQNQGQTDDSGGSEGFNEEELEEDDFEDFEDDLGEMEGEEDMEDLEGIDEDFEEDLEDDFGEDLEELEEGTELEEEEETEEKPEENKDEYEKAREAEEKFKELKEGEIDEEPETEEESEIQEEPEEDTGFEELEKETEEIELEQEEESIEDEPITSESVEKEDLSDSESKAFEEPIEPSEEEIEKGKEIIKMRKEKEQEQMKEEQPSAQGRVQAPTALPSLRARDEIYLDKLNRDFKTDLVVLEWVKYLTKFGWDNLTKLLDYYVDIGWISNDVRNNLLTYSRGIMKEEGQEPEKENITIKDHVESLRFIVKIIGDEEGEKDLEEQLEHLKDLEESKEE